MKIACWSAPMGASSAYYIPLTIMEKLKDNWKRKYKQDRNQTNDCADCKNFMCDYYFPSYDMLPKVVALQRYCENAKRNC